MFIPHTPRAFFGVRAIGMPRAMVHGSIEDHLPTEQLAVLQAPEQSERALLYDIIGRLRTSGGVR